jgi:hypothetical protein
MDLIIIQVRFTILEHQDLLLLSEAVPLKHWVMGMAAIQTMPTAYPHLSIAAFHV